MHCFNPGRYAAIDIGTNSVLLLVADVDEEGRLTPVAEAERTTRLGEGYYVRQRLRQDARARTLDAVAKFMQVIRRSGAHAWTAVGTSVVREATNGPEFAEQVRQECGVALEIISGEREAELAYLGNLYDRSLPGTDGERVVLDIGGGSTELVRGLGETIRCRASYPIGAVRLTELFLHSDPPGISECDAADSLIEQLFSHVDPLPPASLLLGSGGTLWNLARVAAAAGMIRGGRLHGVVLPHHRVTELVDLFRSLPIKFRKRVPGLDPDRADVILAGSMILHQLMAALAVPNVVITQNGVRHGCVYALAQRTLQRR